MKKKSLKMVMVFSFVFAFLLTNVSVLADVPSPWAVAELTEAQDKGLVLPEAQGHYRENITRELFCKLIVNMVEITTGEVVAITIGNPFNDTTDAYVIKAYQLGIVNGTSATTFSPNDLITREQVAAMMMRAARKLDELMNHNLTMIMLVGPPAFADLDEISSWALMDVHEANVIGIMNGVGNNRIAPQGKTTIEQSILMILRVFNEYLPLMENSAPEQLPTAVLTYDVNEGESIDILLADVAYDMDGDTLRISGVGGNISYGNLVNYVDYVTFTAEMVDEDQVSEWNITVTDEVESVTIDLVFNVKDEPLGNPVGNGVTTFIVNEGDNISIAPSDIAIDPNGDLMFIANYNLASGYDTEIGESIIYLALLGEENSFGFTADPVDGDTTTSYDLTVSDGSNETVITVVIEIQEVNAPPEALPMTTEYQDESTVENYLADRFATDPDGDSLHVIAFELNDDPEYASAQHDIGTGSINTSFGMDSFLFAADSVPTAMWTYYDLTISDGLNEIVVTIRIQVNNVD